MKLPPKTRERHKDQGQLRVKCNRIFPASGNLNILLRPSEAIQVAQNICAKMQLLIDGGLADERTVKMWSTGDDNLRFGLKRAVTSRRKKILIS